MTRLARMALTLVGLTLGAWTMACDGESTETGSGGTGATGGSGAAGAMGGGSSTGSTTTGGGATGGTGGAGAEGGSGGTISVEGCPPVEPFGVDPGDVAPDVTLYDCSGAEHHLNELCPHVRSYVYTFAPWCPTCQAAVANGDHEALWQKYQNEDFDLWFVVSSDASTGYPDATDCANAVTSYGLTMPVLYDPTGVTESTLTLRQNAGSLLMAQGNVVVLNGPWAISMIQDDLAQTFGY